MNQFFEIEFLFAERKEAFLFARQIKEGTHFSVEGNCHLGGVPIKSQLSMPRAQKEGKPRFDLFGFHLRNKADISQFKVGQIVELKEDV